MKDLARCALLVSLAALTAAACGSTGDGTVDGSGTSDGAAGEPMEPMAHGDINVEDGGSPASTGGQPSIGTGKGCDPSPGCNDLAIEFEGIRPTMMILVDRSSSMFDIAFGDSPNRWQPLKDALVGPDGLVTQLEADIRFGFASYTNRQAEATCPLVDDVTIAYDNFDAISALYDEVSYDPINDAPSDDLRDTYKGETPTGEAIRAILPQFLADKAPGPKYLMVVTDGEPDTCALADPQCGQYEAIDAVQEAYDQGIITFVVGVGDIGLDHLQSLANAGMGEPVVEPTLVGDCPSDVPTPGNYSDANGSATYYNPEDPNALKNALGDIIGAVRKCSFELSVEVDLETASRGTVLLDCNEIPFDDKNGWRMNTPTELELVGNACGDLKTSLDPFLFVTFPCGSIVK